MKKQALITKRSLRTTLIGILVSAALALVKALGGIFGHSYALVADAIESGSDVLTSTMLWFGLRWSMRPPDKNHPYGHGKAEALVAIGISMALLLAALLIVRDSIANIQQPHLAPAPYTLVILAVVVLVKEGLFRWVKKTGEEMNSSALKADAFHHRSDAITSVAAFVGISIALLGGEGYEMADDYAALVAAVFIGYNAYVIARPAVGELLDESLDTRMHERIVRIAEAVPGVLHVEQCHSRKMGTSYQVDLHIWVNGQLTVSEGHDIAHLVKNRLREKIEQIANVHIHVEPS